MQKYADQVRQPKEKQGKEKKRAETLLSYGSRCGIDWI